MPQPKLITLDPTDLQAQHDVNDQGIIFSTADILQQFYFYYVARKQYNFFYTNFGYSQAQTRITLSKHEFPITLKAKDKKKYKIIVKLTKFVVARPKGKEFRFDVLGDKIGQGAFKYVYDIDATYAYQKNKGLVKKPNAQPLVMLIQPAKDVRNEAAFNNEVPYLCAKNLVIEKKLAFQAVRKLTGITYKEFKQYLINNYQQLTIDERLILTINLLYSLKYLHALDIIHRDLKQENILIDINTLDSKIIDFGLSVRRDISSSSDIKSFVGSPAFSAPEFWLQNRRNLLDKKSDIWSLYLFLWILWEGTNERLDPSVTNIDIYRRIKENKDYTFFQNFCNNIQYLENHEKAQIQTILALDQPYFSQKQYRKSLTKAIEVFENVRLKRLERLTPTVYIAHMAACKTAAKLAFIAEDTHGINRLELILTRIKSGLEEIEESPDTLLEFIRVTKLQSLQGLTTKVAILEKSKAIIDGFNQNINDLLNLSSKIEEKLYFSKTIDSSELSQQLQDLFTDIQSLFAKETKTKVALDDLAKWNITFNKKFNDFKDQFNIINSQLEDQSNLDTLRFRSYSALIENLKPNPSDTPLQTCVKSAIKNYFYETFPQSKSDRAASARRLSDMQDILQIFADHKELDNQALMRKINQRLNKIKTGMPWFFGRSQLRKNIRMALAEFNLAEAPAEQPSLNNAHSRGTAPR